MGDVSGAAKYMVYTPLTVVGFLSMYIYGGGLVTLFNTFHTLFTGKFFQAFLEYFVYSALPPTSIGKILFQVAVGTIAAGSKWFLSRM